MYEILTGLDRGGDMLFHVYDTAKRLTVAIFDSRAKAEAYIATRMKGA